MQNIRSANTKAELIIACGLKRKKIYFARNVKTLIGKPDFVFRRKKVAVFVDSDFWHGHAKRFIMPKSNRTYWKKKITRNKERDKEVNSTLKKDGWRVLRLWGHDINKDPDRCIARILKAVNKIS